MSILRSSRQFPASTIKRVARRLLNASTLCAIATVSPGGRAHLNSAYFAWSGTFDVVWLSAPEAQHSRNLSKNPSVAVAVYDSTLLWGGPDRGVQLFGSARQVAGRAALQAEQLYAKRFTASRRMELRAYRFYRFHPRRMKLFDEREFGSGVFVTARIQDAGPVTWERTEIYRNV